MVMEQDEFILEDNVPIAFERFDEVFHILMSRTWEYNGMFYNLKELGWAWDYYNAKRTLGRCKFYHLTKTGVISISKPLLRINLQKDPTNFEDTIRHEIAHAIDYIVRDTSDHGIKWMDIATHVGANPESCNSNIESVAYKWKGECLNGHVLKRHRLNSDSTHRVCGECRTKIKWNKQF